MSMSLEMTGLKELQARFAEMREDVRGDITRIAVREGAKVIQRAISDAAPVLDRKTAESTALAPNALKEGIRISIVKDEDDFIRARIGPKKYLSHVAYWVEFGHFLVKGGYLSLKRGKLEGKGKRIGWVQQHPFIRPAVDESADAAVARYAEVMAEWLKGKAV